jgi:hypothetical protein
MLLRLEGLVAATFALWLFGRTGGSWWLLVAFVLVPDLSMLGYLAGPRVGAATYNVVHTYVLPAVLAAYGVLTGAAFAVTLALIWVIHIGADRLLGFGLKYETGFKDTDLNRI